MLRCGVRAHVEDRTQHTRILVKVQNRSLWMTGAMWQCSNAALRSPFPRSLCGKNTCSRILIILIILQTTRVDDWLDDEIHLLLFLPYLAHAGSAMWAQTTQSRGEFSSHTGLVTFSTPHPCLHQQAPRET